MMLGPFHEDRCSACQRYWGVSNWSLAAVGIGLLAYLAFVKIYQPSQLVEIFFRGNHSSCHRLSTDVFGSDSAQVAPNNSFKPTPCRGVSRVLYATLAHVRRPATGRLNSGVRPRMSMSFLRTKMGTDTTRPSWWERLVRIDTANPSYRGKHHLIDSWLIEFDEDDRPWREIGLDKSGSIVVAGPSSIDYGFWLDTEMRRSDFTGDPIPEEHFEQLWAASGVVAP